VIFLKRNSSSTIIAAFIVFTLFSVSPAHSSLLAPVYPGSVNIEHGQGPIRNPYVPDTPMARQFYSKDDIDKVLDFYVGHLGEPHHTTGGKGIYHEWKLKEIPGLIGRMYIATDNRDFSTEKLPDQPHMPEGFEGATLDCMAYEGFKPLIWMVEQLPDRSGKDFVEICKRFGHLTWCYFPYAKEPDSRGKPVPMDKYLLDSHSRPGKPLTTEDLEKMYAQAQALAIAGRSEEAAAIGEQMTGDTPSTDWDGHIRLLEKIDEYAYRTVIVINTDPAGWPDDF